MPDLPSESWLDLILLSGWVIGLTCAAWGIWEGNKEDVGMRDIDCKKYNECLTDAAKSNTTLDCGKCKLHDYAVELGHLGGLKGGPARAKALPKEERVRIARKAAMTRWGTLLDCPFCHKSKFEIEEMDINWIAVSCQTEECGILGPQGKTKEEAIKKWNG